MANWTTGQSAQRRAFTTVSSDWSWRSARHAIAKKQREILAEEVSAHDVDEGMETEHMGFTSSIALQYVSQAQVGLTCDLA